MNRIYHNYEKWEDYQNGMYELISFNKDEYRNKLDLVKKLLTNEIEFKSKAIEMISKWVIASEENLTNRSCNRIAWIGQATVCYVYGIPEAITKDAWKELTEDEMIRANIIANKQVLLYERQNSKVHKGMGEEMLF